MGLKDLPKAALVELSAANVVKRYVIGFDVNKVVNLWKFETERGEHIVCYVHPTVAVHYAKATRRESRKLKWPAPGILPPNEIAITDGDWRNESGAKMVAAYRVEAFRDGCIIALVIEKDLGVVLRLSPLLAVQFAQELWDAHRSGDLLEVGSAPAAVSTRQ